MTTPLISVVVLNYEGRAWLGPCLESVFAQRGAPPFEVILVDNASSDDSVRFAADTYPAVRICQAGKNLGFAAGNNLGARHARGRLLVFLNNDTVPAADWLARLYDAAAAHRGSLVTSCIVSLSDDSLVDSAGDGYLRAGGAYKRGHGADAAEFRESGEVFGACGAAFLIERELFERLGGFDERFFMVHEDVDLSYRARLAGYRVWYAAEAVVRHAGSGTLGRLSPQAVYYGQRNLEWTWLKNTPGELLLRTAPLHVLYSAAALLHYLRLGRFGSAVRGKLAAVAALPAILRERRRVQALRSVPAAELERHMDADWLRIKRSEKSARLHPADHQHPFVR